NDGSLDSEPASVTISTLNSKPVADAGPDQSGYVGTTIALDGRGSSDVDGDTLTYRWALTAVPEGSTAVLSNPTVIRPTFVLDAPGTYVAQLIVNDGSLNSDPVTMTMTATLNCTDLAPTELATVASEGGWSRTLQHAEALGYTEVALARSCPGNEASVFAALTKATGERLVLMYDQAFGTAILLLSS